MHTNILLQQIIGAFNQLIISNDAANEEVNKVKEYIKRTFVKDRESIKIESIEPIVNPLLKRKFDTFRQNLKGGSKVLMKLHGTYPKNVEGIIISGFQLPTTNERQNDD